MSRRANFSAPSLSIPVSGCISYSGPTGASIRQIKSSRPVPASHKILEFNLTPTDSVLMLLWAPRAASWNSWKPAMVALSSHLLKNPRGSHRGKDLAGKTYRCPGPLFWKKLQKSLSDSSCILKTIHMRPSGSPPSLMLSLGV